jgi:hypothetical protein
MRLTAATAQFETHSYPATTEELIEAFGETEITLANGTETLGDVLGRLPGETFDSADDANMAAYSAVSSKGIGRKHYSDRDPSLPGEDGPDPLSL